MPAYCKIHLGTCNVPLQIMQTQKMNRIDKRKYNTLRPIKIIPKVNRYAEGSCIIEMGHTQVLCLATIDETFPKWREASGLGWVTAEYAMLPRATHTRSQREATKGKISGRTQEISRLVGRALRSICDFAKLGKHAITIDCEVLQADGGTRCASITGGYIALAMACKKLMKEKKISAWPLQDFVAAISVGIVQGQCVLDLCYEEDATAEVDMNVIATGKGQLVEIQGTAEHGTFSDQQLNQMLKLGKQGICKLVQVQKKILK